MADRAARRRHVEAGRRAEEAVAAHLEARGWEVVARNWTGGGAEIDLVVRRDGALRFVEVKLRRADDPVGLEGVGPRKLQRLRRAADVFLAGHRAPVREACLMVVFVWTDGDRHVLEVLDDPDG